MSDKIDEIIDRLIKGGRGSGRRGHKTPLAPVSDIKRELNPSKKKKLLASDKKAVRGASKELSHEELQSKIDSHRDLSESPHLSPASRESYAAKHKALLAVQKKKGPKPEAPKEEGVYSRPGPFGNINKGGPGSGKKKGSGKIEPKHFEPNPNLRDKNKDLDRLTPEQVKARNSERDRRMKENREARKRGEEPNYDRPSNTAHLDKSLETLFYMKQLAEEGRLKPKNKRNMRKSLFDRLLEKGGPGSGKRGHTTNHEDRNKIASDAIENSPASNMYPLDTFMTDALDEEGGLDYILNNEDDFKQKMVDKYAKNVGTVQPEYVKEAVTYSLNHVKAKLGLNKSEDLEKKQGVPKGVDPAKHERCVMDVKASGKDKSSAFAICNSSMNKSDEDVEKVLPLAGKTIFRTIQNLVKPATGGDGSEADNPIGGHDGASVAHGSGGAKKEKGPGKKMSKSLFERLLEKGGIGSGRKGHHTFTNDGYEHDSVFEDNQFDNVGEREAFKEKMIAAAERAEERARQSIREKESTAKRGVSRKPHATEKKSLLQRIGQKLIDAI